MADKPEVDLTPVRFWDAPPIEFVVGGLLMRGCVTVVAGDPGEGKTALALQISGCMMEEKSFMGLSTYPGKVLWVQQDCSDSQMREGIEMQLKQYPSLVNLGTAVD